MPAGPAAEDVWHEAVLPALVRPDFPGLRRQLQRASRPVFIASGGRINEASILAADAHRLRRVIEKIVRGLYFHHTGRVLPPDHAVSVELRPDDFLRYLAKAGDANVVDKAVFAYRLVLDDSFSMWWLAFYEATLFFAAVGSPEALAAGLQRN